MRYPPTSSRQLLAFSMARRSSLLRAGFSSSAMRNDSVPLLITPSEYKKLPKSTTIPLDVSWHMPNSPRSAVAEYLSGPRIPGARRFDLDEVAELGPEKNPLGLGHMLPSHQRFQEECRKLGIEDNSHVVVYDTVGVFSSPRGAFTFKAMGHEKVSVLDGGLPRWIAEGGEVEVGDVADIGESEYEGAKPGDTTLVRSYEEIVENSSKNPEDPSTDIVLDARALGRYTGEAPEPRPNLSSGHIPNSLPLPFTAFLEPSTSEKPYTSFKSPSELKQALIDGVGGSEAWEEIQSGKKGLVFSCGSGMTAGVGWLASQVVGEDKVKSAIYDESWTGYAMRPESKIVKGDK